MSGQAPGWHPCWEENVYGQGRQLNRYPHHALVGFILSNFGQVSNRSQISILELGCGAGNNLWFAAREGFSVAGIDGSVSAIHYAQRRFATEKLEGDLRVGDFSLLPWPKATFDVVLDRGALTHAPKQIIVAALEESARVLKAGGLIWSMIYSPEHPGRAYGQHRGHNDYDDFSGGYFRGLGSVHFVTAEEIPELYGKRFNIRSAVRVIEEESLGQPGLVNAYWKIQGSKLP